MGKEPTSPFDWARDYEPTPDEKRVLAAAAAGVPCEFDEPAEISGKFLRILMLGVRADWWVAPEGVAIVGKKPGDDEAPRLLTIEGALDLTDARAADGRALPALYIWNARFTDQVTLIGAHLKHLNLAGARDLRLRAEYAQVDRNVQLEDCRCARDVHFVGAQIGGQFNANGARFENVKGHALNLQGATVKGGVFLRDAEATGGVHAAGLTTDGAFDANGATFKNERGFALNLQGASVKGGVFLDGAEATGGVHAMGLETDFQFNANGAQFENENGYALDLQGATVKGGVFLRSAKATGGVGAAGLTIEGQFSAKGATFKNERGHALNLQRATVKGDVFLRGAEATGGVQALGLMTDGAFAAEGATFKNEDGVALTLQGASVKGGVYLLSGHNDRPAAFRGQFYAPNAEFGDLIAQHAQFDPGSTACAVNLDRAKILNRAWVDGAEANGTISADGLSVGGELRLDRLKPGYGKAKLKLDLRNAQIDGVLTNEGLGRNAVGERPAEIDLRGAHIARIVDKLPNAGGAPRRLGKPWLLTEAARQKRREARLKAFCAQLRLDKIGLTPRPLDGWADKVLFDRTTYGSIAINRDGGNASDAKAIAERRVAWLLREYPGGEPPKGEFNPQPFEQLAKTLRAQGEGEAANKITIRRRRFERQCIDLSPSPALGALDRLLSRANGFLAKLFGGVLDISSCYGYEPGRAAISFVIYWLVGGFLALLLDVTHKTVDHEGAPVIGFEPELTVGQPRSDFEPFIYALDLITPFVEFGQAINYRIAPSCPGWREFPFLAHRAGCQWLEWAQGLYSVFGYILFSITVLTLTGVLRRD